MQQGQYLGNVEIRACFDEGNQLLPQLQDGLVPLGCLRVVLVGGVEGVDVLGVEAGELGVDLCDLDLIFDAQVF